jgi:hypothetical protein
MAGKPVNKWIQSIFWFISALPSFQHIPQHATGDYVGRTSSLLGTLFGVWIVLIGTIVLWLIANGTLAQWSWGDSVATVLNVAIVFTVVLYIAGFWQFFSREEEYPN